MLRRLIVGIVVSGLLLGGYVLSLGASANGMQPGNGSNNMYRGNPAAMHDMCYDMMDSYWKGSNMHERMSGMHNMSNMSNMHMSNMRDMMWDMGWMMMDDELDVIALDWDDVIFTVAELDSRGYGGHHMGGRRMGGHGSSMGGPGMRGGMGSGGGMGGSSGMHGGQGMHDQGMHDDDHRGMQRNMERDQQFWSFLKSNYPRMYEVIQNLRQYGQQGYMRAASAAYRLYRKRQRFSQKEGFQHIVPLIDRQLGLLERAYSIGWQYINETNNRNAQYLERQLQTVVSQMVDNSIAIRKAVSEAIIKRMQERRQEMTEKLTRKILRRLSVGRGYMGRRAVTTQGRQDK